MTALVVYTFALTLTILTLGVLAGMRAATILHRERRARGGYLIAPSTETEIA